MAKYGMAIDLRKCVGCGACGLACKTENNTEYERDGRRYNWADYLTKTTGTWNGGDLKFQVIPVLCNHCTFAPCVDICPVDPKAIYKTEDGLTMINQSRCIGDQLCQLACPYSSKNIDNTGVQYSVLTMNPFEEDTQSFYDNDVAIISGGTSTPLETATLAAHRPPDENVYMDPDYTDVRPSGVVEKCILCRHRTVEGLEPYCVVSCPTGARVYGDLDDPVSDISKLVAQGYKRLKNNKGEWLAEGEEGTSPNVYYVGDYNITGIKNHKPEDHKKSLLLFPNPARNEVHVEFEMENSGIATIQIYDIRGKEVKRPLDKSNLSKGKHRIRFKVYDLKPGTYIVRVIADKEIFSANMIVTR
ncbi:MAG TPA: T9SS type A sorting domain-containing protein [Bacteroidetes bacterium]|nr:T9SS type A sorting domain-containing protein [Bacteroidota bacterium]